MSASSQSTAGAGAAPLVVQKGRSFLLMGMIATQASTLVRYVLLARLLGPTQLGLGSTLILTAALFELITDTAGDRFLLSDPEGGLFRTKSLVHFVFVARGILIAILMIIFAPVIAGFFDSPSLTVPLMILALSPLIYGFENLDFRSVQRRGEFSAEGFIRITAELANLVVTVAVAAIYHSYVAVLIGQIARSTTWMVATHVWSTEKYRLKLDKVVGARMLSFSTPLLLSGLAVYLGMQGDRVVIGRQLGVTALGLYSAVLLLVNTPSSALMNYVQTIFLPKFAILERQVDPHVQRKINLSGVAVVLALAMSAGFSIVAPVFVRLLYGPAFSMGRTEIAIIGILQSCRFLSIWPVTTALAFGRSGNVLLTNIIRMGAWPLGLALAKPFGLEGVVFAFILGELIATSTGLGLLHHLIPGLAPSIRPMVFFLLGSAIVWAWSVMLQHHWGVTALAAGSIVTLGFVAWLVRNERHSISDAIELFLHRRLL